MTRCVHGKLAVAAHLVAVIDVKLFFARRIPIKLSIATIGLTENATKGPFSRDATQEELQTSLMAEIDRRMGRYDGTQFYHLGVSIDGYILAMPGIPVVASPKSAMIISVRHDGQARLQRKSILRSFTALGIVSKIPPARISGGSKNL